MHYHEGILQSYLDNELFYEETVPLERHLAQCTACRELLQQLSREEQFVQEQLNVYSKAAVGIQPNVDQSWDKFLKNLSGGEAEKWEQLLPCKENVEATERGWKPVKKWKRWLSAAAAAAVVMAAFTLSPVQSAAADFLKIFRVERIETVKMTPADIQEIVEKIRSEVGTVDLNTFGQVEVLKKSQYDKISVEEAKGYGFVEPAYLPEGVQPEAEVGLRIGERLNFALNVEAVNGLIEQLGGKNLLPSQLEGKTFTVNLSDMLARSYRVGTEGFLRVSTMQVPSIEVNADVDHNQLMAPLWGMPFLPEEVRAQLRQAGSLDNTLVVPEVEGDSEKTVIAGTTVLRRVPRAGHMSYLWIEGERMFFVESTNLAPAETEQIVRSLL